jgi:septal ring factor EnvC (AmiA/AmiB activator)
MTTTTPSTATPMTMHAEHRLWESEISLWRDDLRAWQQELSKAQGEIKQLEKALEDHAHALRIHASTLRLQEQTIDGHEHELAQYEKGGEGEELFQMARQHSAEAGRHNEHRNAHEQLKRRHHNVIAHWSLLLRALREPAEGAPPAARKAIVGAS